MKCDGKGESALVGLGGFVETAQMVNEASGRWWLRVGSPTTARSRNVAASASLAVASAIR
jgi:hypothetical protein